jgi:hypothetical protein
MQAMTNMSGIIAAEVGKGVGRAMQSVARSSPTQASSLGSGNDAKAYTQDQIATLLGFHGAKTVRWLQPLWRIVKLTKAVNYDCIRRMLKIGMMRWADQHRCWIDEGVYFDNKTIDDWIALKFNPGDSQALYASAEKGISILKCREPTSAVLEDLRRNEEIWDATKANATYFEVSSQARNRAVNIPASDFSELRQNIAKCLAVLFVWKWM